MAFCFVSLPPSFVKQKFYAADLATDATRGDSKTVHDTEVDLSEWDELLDDDDDGCTPVSRALS